MTQILDLSDCSRFKMSSGTLGNITMLEYLNLSDCNNVNKLLPLVACQPSWERLGLIGTNLKELSRAIGDLSKLEDLWLGSNMLEEFPSLLLYFKSLKGWIWNFAQN